MKQGEIADFSRHCGTPALDPKNEQDPRWQDTCRMISSSFVVDLLTRAPWRNTLPFEGVQITGARIVGKIDLENAKLIRPIEIAGSRIEGALKLDHAHTDSLIRLDGSLIDNDVSADGLQDETDLYFANGAKFTQPVSLKGAKIYGDLNMTGAGFDGLLDA
jgi:hypothetical protein